MANTGALNIILCDIFQGFKLAQGPVTVGSEAFAEMVFGGPIMEELPSCLDLSIVY
jgi:hypothetical protein